MDLSGHWGSHHGDKTNTSHFLIGPYGTQEPLGYGTLCGSLSGAIGWHRSDRVARRCSLCSIRLAPPANTVGAPAEDQPTERAAREFWNGLTPTERNALIAGTFDQSAALIAKLADAGMILVPVDPSDEADVAPASDGSSSDAAAPEVPPSQFLARELILIIDGADPVI